MNELDHFSTARVGHYCIASNTYRRGVPLWSPFYNQGKNMICINCQKEGNHKGLPLRAHQNHIVGAYPWGRPFYNQGKT